MKHITSKIITQIIIYVVIIVGIFILQFTKGKTFSIGIGTMSVSGYYETDKNQNKTPLLPIQIVSNGINFYASQQHPIIALIDDLEKPLEVLSYNNTQNEFSIQCSDSVKLIFHSDTRGDVNTTYIKAIFPENVKSVRMPWKITQKAKFERKAGKSFIKFGSQYFEFLGNFGFNEIGVVDFKEQPHVILTALAPTGKYRTFVENKGVNLSYIADMSGSDKLAFNQARDSFATVALSSFGESIKQKTYDELLVTAYIAEMSRRNMYIRAKNEVPANALRSTYRTWLSCTFYGNLIQNYAQLLELESNERSKISKLISEKNIKVFEIPNLITYLIDRNSEMLINDLKFVLAENEISKFTTEQSLGILEAYMDYNIYYPDKENFMEKLTDTCSRKVKEAITIIDDNIYLSVDEKTVDTIITLKAVRILQRLSEFDSIWNSVSQKLFTSLLSFAGESASLPAKFTLSGNDSDDKSIIVTDTKVLSPAELYPHVLMNNPWYPHAKSLALDVKHGIWAWTSAEKIEVIENSESILSFNVKLVEKGTHYMVIRNIRPFKNIEIHELDFRTDPRFEIYDSSGYVYNAQTSTLYLKLKHKKDVEKITLSFK